MAKYRLTLSKTFEVDTSKWGKAGEDFLADGLPEDENLQNPSPDALHDSIRDALRDDMESGGVDLGDIDSDDFTIEILDPKLETQPNTTRNEAADDAEDKDGVEAE